MSQLREVRGKLESARSLGEVVESMRTLAAIYVRRAESTLTAIRPYAEVVETALAEVLERVAPAPVGPAPDETQSAILVVFSSDQGLAGAYNDRVVGAAVNFKRSRPDLEIGLVTIGRRAKDLLVLRGESPLTSLPGAVSLEAVKATVRHAAARIYGLYFESRSRSLFFVYNVYESVGRFHPTVQQVLPPQRRGLHRQPHRTFRTEPLLEAPAEVLLERFAEQFFFIQLYRALLESQASENGARLASMSQASSNIEDTVKELTTRYRSARQDEITSELLDVVSGAEALRGND